MEYQIYFIAIVSLRETNKLEVLFKKEFFALKMTKNKYKFKNVKFDSW